MAPSPLFPVKVVGEGMGWEDDREIGGKGETDREGERGGIEERVEDEGKGGREGMRDTLRRGHIEYRVK